MAYFNYHAKVQNLIKTGHLTRFEIVKSYNNISPALVLFFDCTRPMPIREYRFYEYFSLFEELKMINVDIVHGTKLLTNNYIVGNQNECVLVDASASLEAIEDIIGKRKLLAVLLTHGHWDHFQTLDDIVKKYSVKCYCDENALYKMKNNNKHFVGNREIETNLDNNSFIFVKNGDSLDFGEMKFEVFQTYGHTNCSICFLMGRFLFAGDTLFSGTCGRCDLPTGSEKDMVDSLKKILALPQSIVVFPGHGETTTIEREKKTFAHLV